MLDESSRLADSERKLGEMRATLTSVQKERYLQGCMFAPRAASVILCVDLSGPVVLLSQ